MFNNLYNPQLNPPIYAQQIVRVNGQQGANAYQMPANSSALLLDNTDAIVWLAQSDGAGYKTVTPYTITPYQPEPPIDVKSLLERVQKLEEKLNNDKPYIIKTQRDE